MQVVERDCDEDFPGYQMVPDEFGEVRSNLGFGLPLFMKIVIFKAHILTLSFLSNNTYFHSVVVETAPLKSVESVQAPRF